MNVGRIVLVGLAAAALVATAVVALRLWEDRSRPDRYFAGDRAAFAPYRAVGEGANVAGYDSLDAAVEASDLVVVGEIVDVRPTRVLVGEVPTDKVHMIGLVLDPTDVLKGPLPEADRDAVVIEFIGGSADPAAVDELRDALPRGQSTWLLTSHAERAAGKIALAKENGWYSEEYARQVREGLPFYQPISYQGTFSQGGGYVVSAIDINSGSSAIAKEAARYGKLSELNDRLRDLAAD